MAWDEWRTKQKMLIGCHLRDSQKLFIAFIETDDKKMKSINISNSALFAWEKQDHLRMNDSTGSNNHLRSIDLFRSIEIFRTIDQKFVKTRWPECSQNVVRNQTEYSRNVVGLQSECSQNVVDMQSEYNQNLVRMQPELSQNVAECSRGSFFA